MNDLEVLLELSQLTGRSVTRLYSEVPDREVGWWRAIFAHRDRLLGDSGG